MKRTPKKASPVAPAAPAAPAPADGFLIRTLDPAQDARNVADLIAMTFGHRHPEEIAERLRRASAREARNCRCLEKDGRIVSYLEILPKRMYLGRSLLRLGGVASVCTEYAYRMRGYGRALFVDAMMFMRREGYDASILWGVPHYYNRYGYAAVMARHFYTIPQTEIQRGRHFEFERTAIKAADLPALGKFHAERTRYVDGAMVRDIMRLPHRGFKLTDRLGRIAGYVNWNSSEDTMTVNEAIARDAKAAMEIVLGLKMMAMREGVDLLHLRMPPGYPVTNALSTLNSTYHRNNSWDRGWMGITSNLPALVDSMRAEWSWRLKSSRHAGRNATVAMRVGGDRVTLTTSRGRVAARVGAVGASGDRSGSFASPQRFLQLAFGVRSLSEISADKDVRLAPKDVWLFETIFPQRNAFPLLPDSF